jgi:HemY protein
MNPDSAEGHMAAAHAALNAQLWGEARAALAQAEALRPNARLYKMMAEVETVSGSTPEKAREWLSKAENAPPEKVWTCRATGRIYSQWAAIAQPHGTFNTMEWGYPESIAPQDALALTDDINEPDFLPGVSGM